MKKLTTILSLVLLSSTVFGADRASKQERKFLCQAVNAMLDQNSADYALVDNACSESATIASVLKSEGVRSVIGQLKFNSPDRLDYTLTCKAVYYGQPTLENMEIVGGVGVVSCQ